MAPLVAGADGCRAGWVVVLADGSEVAIRVVPHFTGVLDVAAGARVIGVDMPIGLLDAASPGGRRCDRQARDLLKSPRRNSVFSPPVRAALRETTFEAAGRVNRDSSPHQRGISQQCFGLFCKLREVDEAMRGDTTLARKVREVHPEVSFRALAGGSAGLESKKSSAAGSSIRLSLLRRVFASIDETITRRRPGVSVDDVLDAHVVCWTAGRIVASEGVRLPEGPALFDSAGLPMAIWY